MQEQRAKEVAAFKAQTRNQVVMLAGGGRVACAGRLCRTRQLHGALHRLCLGLLCRLPGDLEGVSHSLHTPLMAVTNAISGIVILGALLQIGSGNWLVVILAAISVLIAAINIVGGFLVTRRMLAMFQKS